MMKMLDQRLEALQTDHLDLFFVHALGDEHSTDQAIEWAKGKAFRQAAEAIRKSGKAKFVGFSTHHKDRDKIIQAAADGGFVDAIMMQHTAWLPKDTALNKAIDACYAKGIGLISMKQIAGPNPGAFLAEVPKHVPDLKERGLKPFQAMLHAIWTDERISTCCVSCRSVEQIRENAEAARTFAPLKQAELDGLHRAFLASRPSLCADCDGRCGQAGGTDASLGDLTRYLTYHDRHGFRTEARRLYAAMPDALRDWKGADLAAAQAACPNHLNFSALLPEVERHLA